MNPSVSVQFLVLSTLVLVHGGLTAQVLDSNDVAEGSAATSSMAATSNQVSLHPTVTTDANSPYSDDHTTEPVVRDVTKPMLVIAFGLLGFFVLLAFVLLFCLCKKYGYCLTYAPLEDTEAGSAPENTPMPTDTSTPATDASTPAATVGSAPSTDDATAPDAVDAKPAADPAPATHKVDEALAGTPAPTDAPVDAPAPIEVPADDPAPIEAPADDPAPIEEPVDDPAPIEAPAV